MNNMQRHIGEIMRTLSAPLCARARALREALGEFSDEMDILFAWIAFERCLGAKGRKGIVERRHRSWYLKRAKAVERDNVRWLYICG